MTGVKFFVPAAESAEQAERVYEDLLKASSLYRLLHPKARLYSLTFQHNGHRFRATVGQAIPGWSDHVGVVLAIIETQQLVYVHTQRGVALQEGPILAGHPSDCRDRQWFEDFPLPGQPNA